MLGIERTLDEWNVNGEACPSRKNESISKNSKRMAKTLRRSIHQIIRPKVDWEWWNLDVFLALTEMQWPARARIILLCMQLKSNQSAATFKTHLSSPGGCAALLRDSVKMGFRECACLPPVWLHRILTELFCDGWCVIYSRRQLLPKWLLEHLHASDIFTVPSLAIKQQWENWFK